MGIKKEEISTREAPKISHGAISVPVSQCIKAGNMIFVTADARDSSGQVIKHNFEKAARQALENVRATLGAAGASMEDIVRVDVYLQNMEDYDLFNAVYAEYVPKPYPVRSVSQPARTPMDIPIGMVVTAIVA